jgi:Acetyltransferases, including N-acetylases of ribosomal proteins
MKYLLQKFETERILFREIDLKDFDAWLEFFKDPESFKHWKEELQSPEIECNKWYTKQFDRYETNRGGMNALIEKSTGKLIGHCGLLVQTVDGQTELEIGYSLLSDFRGMGFAYEAASACKTFAFQNNFNDSLISIISLTNTPSASVAIKNGMMIDKQTVYNGNAVNIFRINKPSVA